MRYLLLASLIAGCSVTPEPVEPSQPAVPDASGPMQTPSTNVFASSFDTYCTRDDDCVAAYEGNACAPCRCANTAIRRDALPEYRAELGAYWSCYAPEDCAADCTSVIGDPAICVAGRCSLPQ
jgi:hypothetical protein